jgi:hypothetical protein
MTPYEHYCEAERLLAEAVSEWSLSQTTVRTALVAEAQVHATLACANDETGNRASRSRAQQRERQQDGPDG